MLAGRSPVAKEEEQDLKADFGTISMERRQPAESVGAADSLDSLIDDLDALDL